METTLAPLESEIYGIIHDSSDWLSLREIAGYLMRKNGKPLPGDRSAVRSLVQRGVIEMQERTRVAAQIYFVYRAKPE